MADKRKRVQLDGDEEESKPKQLQQDQPVDSESSDDDMGPMPTTAAAGDEESDDNFGPGLPAAQPITKAIRKELKHEKVFLANLPCAEMYEKSYMHRDRITHVVSAQATDFCITASCDGHVKFWKKMDQGIEFVKLYRAHLGRIIDVALSADNLRFCTVAEDQALKIFDVVTYDMMHMISLHFVPLRCEWVYRPGSAKALVAVSDRDSPKVYIYDVYKTDAPISVLSSHASPVVCLAYSPNFDVVISADTKGVMDYWSPLADDHRVPDGVTKFRFKMETDLYELAKQKTMPTSITISKTGRRFAVTALDQQVRVFRFRDGKKQYQFNESLEFYDQLQAENKLGVDAMDYGRRQAVENEIFESLNQHLHSIHTGEAKKADEDAIEMGTYTKGANKEYITPVPNVLFDDSGNFLLYATMIGIKVVNMVTGHTVRMLGNVETTERFLHLTLYQGIPNVSSQFRMNKAGAAASIGAANARGTTADPTLFASSFKKNRFYCFSRREPVDDDGVTEGRDVFNEKPTKSDQMLAQGIRLKNKLGSEAVIHTSMGDIWVKLMPDRTPKTVENFSVHARNGYYDGCIFHRVIKDFMVQTGDPTGLGNGGESIWGGEFEDEVHDDLKHDSPFTVSMANGGPGTNGSQFFITTVKCPWLDGKHTVFGRVTRGMDTVKTIEMSKVDDTSRPFDEIKIINIDIK